jgi:peptidyl-prolyl cis-trans isomerase SurA
MKNISIILTCLLAGFTATSQKTYQTLDAVMAVVGNETILLSDIEIQKSQLITNGYKPSPDLECRVLESLLFEKLLLHRARIDSVVVSEEQVQGELDRRVAMFSEQLGGEDNLVAYYGKSIAEIRLEFHDALEDQLLVQQVQQSITQGLRITPSDVEEFYASIPVDSIPLIDSEVEVSQLVIKPEPSEAEIQRVKDRLNGFREEVLAGKDFETLAVLYSEDPGSAVKGGELGLVGRGRMVTEFEQIAYNLKEGEVSKVFKSDFGYHLMQMKERKGDLYNARHILLKPRLISADLQNARIELERIANLIKTDSLTFQQAALTYSDEESTKNNNGIIINPNTGSIRFPVDELDPQLFLVVDKLKVGEMSEPVIMRSPAGDQAYRVVKLRYRSEPHKANLKDDYQLLQEMARRGLSDEALSKWLDKYIKTTYIRLDEDLGECTLERDWLPVR